MATKKSTPQVTGVEKIGFSVGALLESESAFMRGFNMSSDPDVKAAIEAKNQAERERCKAAILAMLK